MVKKYLLTHQKGKFYVKPVESLDPEKVKVISHPLRFKILRELAKKPTYPAQLANKFGVHEQKIYYHIRKLLEQNLINLAKKKEKRGGIAKYYQVSSPAFSVEFGDEKRQITRLTNQKYSKFLEPFISNGTLNSFIVVGSPDPHGEYKSRGADGFCAIDLGILLGNLAKIRSFPVYKLDTELKEREKQENMIMIGGPKTNALTAEINDQLPIKFERGWNILSNLSGKKYSELGYGIVVKKRNPFNPKKKILVLAGKRFSGTRASILALVNHLEEICKGNKYDKKVNAKVVWGYDKRGDGTIDSVEIVE